MKTLIRDGLEEKIDDSPKVSKTREGHVVEKYSVKGRPRFFVTLAGSHLCAHGNTLTEAITDAIWKDPSRRPSLESLRDEIVKSGKDRKITLGEFQILTGACSEGCRVALERAKLDGSPMTGAAILKHFPEWGSKLFVVLGWPCS
jgi:hypothetical protein